MDFYKDCAAIEAATFVIVVVLFNFSPDGDGKGEIHSADVIGIVGWDIAEVLAVAVMDGDGFVVVFVLRFWFQITNEVTNVLTEAASEVDSSSWIAYNR